MKESGKRNATCIRAWVRDRKIKSYERHYWDMGKFEYGLYVLYPCCAS